jgi:hypothetical protein
LNDKFCTPTVSYSDVQKGWSGAGSNDINADPLFVDAAAGNLHLQPGSPAIDAGTNTYSATGPNLVPSFDLDGNPRPVDGGTGKGAITDMGAYEFQVPPKQNHPPTLAVPGPQTAAENVAKTISGIMVGDPDGDNLTVTLSVGHGTLTLDPSTTTALTKASGNGSGVVMLAGSIANLNTALASLAYLGGHDYSGPDKLNISVSDLSLNISGSVVIAVESPAQQAADLQAQVTALQKKGVLNGGQANSLIVKLNLKGNNGDIGKVQAFLSEVNDLVTAGILNPAQAKALSDPGNNLLLSLMRQ